MVAGQWVPVISALRGERVPLTGQALRQLGRPLARKALVFRDRAGALTGTKRTNARGRFLVRLKVTRSGKVTMATGKVRGKRVVAILQVRRAEAY
jgi:hypothetical protein